MINTLGPAVKILLLSTLFLGAQALGQTSKTAQKTNPNQKPISKLRAIKSPEQRVVEIDKLFASRSSETGLQTNIQDLAELRAKSCGSPDGPCDKHFSWVRSAASEKILNSDLLTWMQIVPLSLSKLGFENFRLETEKLSLEDPQLGLRSQILFHYAIEVRKSKDPSADLGQLIFAFDPKAKLDSQTTSFFEQVASEISTPYSTKLAAVEMLMSSVLSNFNPESKEAVEIIPWLMRTLMIDLNRPDLVMTMFNEVKKHSAKLPTNTIIPALEIFCIAARVTLASQSCIAEATKLSGVTASMETANALDTNNHAEIERLLKKERLALPLILEAISVQNLWMLYYASQYHRLKNNLKIANLYIEAFRKLGENDPFVATFYEIEIARILRLQNELSDSTYNLALAKRRAVQLWGEKSFVSLLVKIEFLKNLVLTKKTQDATELRKEILEEIANKPSLALYADVLTLIDKLESNKSSADSILGSGKTHPDLMDVEMIAKVRFKAGK